MKNSSNNFGNNFIEQGRKTRQNPREDVSPELQVLSWRTLHYTYLQIPALASKKQMLSGAFSDNMG